ncbi:hypothetical protein [Methylocystis bryophila]|uniref:Uncharacterized protein n=1 Tax=Methylocystis bryophila TaxID=655015 RepID=A0A1W6MYL9_9HYPH|nr:hypothetical protein [Methylocystis bryophila]ARN82675.1 hypothetical protein B1812_18020 [Methylocystis bryophila]BDV38896.1 hypothetical protein DSM21852_21490 [Methylocystis bryophila]
MTASLLWKGFKGLCYLALAVNVGAFAAAAALEASGLCSAINEGYADCGTPVLSQIAYTVGMIPVISIFTLVPFLLAILGVVFLVGEMIRGIFRRRGPEKLG